ncbi:MAG: site-specific integrase [Acidobacteria bacterium]|nr:site-specific integrase [Acidobacteriota bacterium]
MGLYKRGGSRFWWMSYTVDGLQQFRSTKTTSKDLAKKIWKKREGEIALDLFKVGSPGERIKFYELCQEFEHSHLPTLATRTRENVRMFLQNLRTFFGDRTLAEVDTRLIEDYRNNRSREKSKNDPTRAVKGATVNRELAYLKCMLGFAVKRKYIQENPAVGVKHFDERRERPTKRMLTLNEERQILEKAPPYLRVAIILLAQTGVRTYSEGFSLRWDQVDLNTKVVYLTGSVKTPGSSEPVPLTNLACDVLRAWKKEQGNGSPFLFPSPVKPDRPVTTVKTAWRSTLKNANVTYFPIYHLRHVFCTRLSWVAPDAIVQRAMRHMSPETKRHYQLGMAEQVRQSLERANRRVYGGGKVLHIHDSPPPARGESQKAAGN